MNIDSNIRLKRIGETVDRLMTLDLWCKFAGEDVVLGMYEAALAKVKPRHRSLTLAAAEALRERCRPGSQVLICTGLVLPPWMVAETDGPPGATVLARMLNLALKVSPVILIGPRWIEAVRQVVIAAGLTPVSDPELQQGRRGACAVVPFPTSDQEAAPLANRARGTFINIDEVVQPAPAPRFSRSKPVAPVGPGSVTTGDEALTGWGLPAREIADLRTAGVIR